ALAALCASVMSTIDSHLNYGAQTLVNDVLRQIFPQANILNPATKSCLWIGRILMLGILGCGIAVMYAAESLFSIATIVAGMFASSAAFYWAQWWWWRVNFPSWVAAMVGGPSVYFALGWVLPLWPWWQNQLEVSAAQADSMAMLQAIISITLTSVIWVTAAFLFPPESEQTLCNFFRRARPLGAWGPIRKLVESKESETLHARFRYLFLAGTLVAGWGAFWIILVVLSLSQLMVGRYTLAGLLALGSLAGAILFLPFFRWHIARMEASQDIGNV
ncbi:MAG: hypothetical protein MJA83_20330, partial [Gammaproteobacteria bacterium]|nr:hypothetical protein [Gammaproteobacteria bacterium]